MADERCAAMQAELAQLLLARLTMQVILNPPRDDTAQARGVTAWGMLGGCERRRWWRRSEVGAGAGAGRPDGLYGSTSSGERGRREASKGQSMLCRIFSFTFPKTSTLFLPVLSCTPERRRRGK